MSRGRLFWASLFILSGALLLLNNLGMLPIALSSLIWPLLLIFVGAWFLLRGTRTGGQMESRQMSIPREGAERVRLKLEHAAGRLTIGPGAGSQELLKGEFAGGVRSRVDRRADMTSVRLIVPSGSWFDFPFGGEGGLAWRIELAPDLRYELEINTAAGESRLDLSDLKVEVLKLETGASSTSARLPASVERGTVAIEAGMASVELTIPQGVAARIRSESGLSKVEVDENRFPRTDGEYLSADYESAEKRLDISIQTGVGSVKIR